MTKRVDADAPTDLGSAPTAESQAEAAAMFAALLADHEPFFDHEVRRPQGLLRSRCYAASIPAASGAEGTSEC